MGNCPSHYLCSQRRDYFLSCKPNESHTSGGKFCFTGAFYTAKRKKQAFLYIKNCEANDLISIKKIFLINLNSFSYCRFKNFRYLR